MMEFLETLSVIAAAILAARAFFRTRALTANILALDAKVAGLDRRLSRLDAQSTIAPEATPVEAFSPEEAAGAHHLPVRKEPSCVPEIF